MEKRIGLIRRIDTDFFCFERFLALVQNKKSVSIRPIRPIRSPIVSPQLTTPKLWVSRSAPTKLAI
jgi:hypothetical protein